MKQSKSHYNNTILRMMMEFPTLFPSELACQNYLFLCSGTGYQWEEGKLTPCYSSPRPIRRTRKDIVGERKIGEFNKSIFIAGDHPHFHEAGNSIVLFSAWGEFSPIDAVLRGEVVPDPDWKKAIERFCFKLLTWSIPQYRKIVEGYLLFKGYAGPYRKERLQAEVVAYEGTRNNAVKLLETFGVTTPSNAAEKRKNTRRMKKLANEILDENSAKKETQTEGWLRVIRESNRR